MKKVNYESQYTVRPTDDLRLEVVIGDGQFGSTLVRVGDTVLQHVHDFDQILGKGSELVGKALKVLSIVTDTNAQTNRTSVTYRLTGGPVPLEHVLALEVDNDNDSIGYEANFTLMTP